MFDTKDREQIEKHGLSLQQVENQIDNFKKGFDFLSIDRAATVGDGIQSLCEESLSKAIDLYDGQRDRIKTVKFVPASGAATRMFKDLFEFIGEGRRSDYIDTMLANIDRFAFGGHVKKSGDRKETVASILGGDLGYGSQPKGLILFHKYKDGNRTAAEEHLEEGALYASSGNTVHIHFTVSPEHRDGFAKLFDRTKEAFENRHGIRYHITFSFQKGSTDTIAVTPDNEPLRNDDRTLLFRPAGHGALIENLNDIEADVIFIKTIDNVAPDRLKGDTIKYKKALAGTLLQLQNDIFRLLRVLDYESDNGQAIDMIADFVEQKLCYKLPESFSALAVGEKKSALHKILNRPARVCGMVRNEGEPGGGPFRVKGKDGSLSLQIAESSQISPQQMPLMKEATHFNPVDIVCGVRDYRGRKFDLTRYTDPGTGFISEKSKDGRKLKAQELPGLWNGAMADWNTVFVEVPISTFSPVKVVNDLLRPQHQ